MKLSELKCPDGVDKYDVLFRRSSGTVFSFRDLLLKGMPEDLTADDWEVILPENQGSRKEKGRECRTDVTSKKPSGRRNPI